MVHTIPEHLSCSQGRLPWASLKIQKGHRKVNIEFVWDVDVEHRCNFLRSYHIQKVSDAEG